MNSKIQFVYNALWMIQPVLQLGVAGIMLRRKLHKTFPVFFAYIVSQLPIFCLVFSAYKWGNYEEYFYSYWICAAISLVLGFKVIHEIFLDVFRPYHALKDLGSVLFKWSALVMVLVAIVVAAASSVSAEGPLVESVTTVQRCVRVIQVGLILLLMVFSKYVGVSWRHFSFGVSLGFGTFALVELLVVALYTSDRVSAPNRDLANMTAYDLSVLIWLAYCVMKSPAREAVNTLLTSQRWDHGLGDIQHPQTPDSLIPVFESMVYRAFSRMEPVPSETPALEKLEKLTAPKTDPSRATSASSKT